jgi:hypothetical protein
VVHSDYNLKPLWVCQGREGKKMKNYGGNEIHLLQQHNFIVSVGRNNGHI